MPSRAATRMALRRARRRVQTALERVSPAGLVRLPPRSDDDAVALVCVYRARNAATVTELLAELPPGAHVALWALDEVSPELATHTLGTGPGGRLDLLGRLIGSLPAVPSLLVIADDDVRFVIGDLGRLLRAGSAMGFDLFQPSHSGRSRAAFTFTHKHPYLFARETGFVEQGPLVVLNRAAQAHLLPFPERFGMGWGVEVRWSRAAEEHGLRLGIVDAVTIRHIQLERTYDDTPERERLRHELATAGLHHLRDLQHTVERLGPFVASRRARRRVTPRSPTLPVLEVEADDGAVSP